MERVLAVKSATYLACPISTFAMQDCRAPLLIMPFCRLSHTSGATRRIPVGDQAARAFAPFWQPRHLKISPKTDPQQLTRRIHLFGRALTHLEVSARFINNLAWLQGTPHLRCLSLRKLMALHPGDYCHLLHVPRLMTLDLFGMTRSRDHTGLFLGRVLARLQNLKVLNLGSNHIGDKLVEEVTLGRRLAAWSRDTGQALNAEQLQWPQTNICQLRLARTNITDHSLKYLSSLPELQLLDVRHTSVGYSALLLVKMQFGLSNFSDFMLTASYSLALAAHQNKIACACCTQGANTPLGRWTEEGVTTLLSRD